MLFCSVFYIKKNMKKKTDLVLQSVFIVLLIIECIAFYKSKFHVYQAARLATSAILFLMIYKGDKTTTKNIYVYIAFSFVALADILTMFFSDILFYIGMSMFTFSYISIATIFYRSRKIRERKTIPPTLYVLAITLTILMGIYCYIPDTRENVSIVLIILQLVVLSILLLWAIKVNRRVNRKNPLYVAVAVLIIAANICYILDIKLLNRKYVFLDIVVILLHGLYMILLATAVRKNKKKEETHNA